MIFEETCLKGAFVVRPVPFEDERGIFARTFCAREFEEHGLSPVVAQCNTSYNWVKGTIRGMHFQEAPKQEDKLVRCARGSIYDVILDLRPKSLTYCEWFSIELSAGNRLALYAPKGFAHGFQTLEDDSEVFYQISEFYSPEHYNGVRWDDPSFGIEWPLEVTVICERDRSYPDYLR